MTKITLELGKIYLDTRGRAIEMTRIMRDGPETVSKFAFVGIGRDRFNENFFTDHGSSINNDEREQIVFELDRADCYYAMTDIVRHLNTHGGFGLTLPVRPIDYEKIGRKTYITIHDAFDNALMVAIRNTQFDEIVDNRDDRVYMDALLLLNRSK